MGWLTVIGAIFQVIILLLQSHYSKEKDVKQLKADWAKSISDSIASGDIGLINSTVQRMRS